MTRDEMKRVGLYIPEWLKEKVEAEAERQKRSMNDLITQWIKENTESESVEDAILRIKLKIAEIEEILNKKGE